MQPRSGFLNGGGADIYAPDDASGPTTTAADYVPSRDYQPTVPNIILGALGLAVLALVVHHWRR